MNANAIITENLMKLLCSKPNEFKNITFDENITLTELLEKLRGKSGITKPDIVIRTGLSKTYIYQLFNGEYIPGRNVLLRLAFALNASVDDTQRLLMLAKKSVLYPKIKRDAAIIVCLSQKNSETETNEFLQSIGEETLL